MDSSNLALSKFYSNISNPNLARCGLARISELGWGEEFILLGCAHPTIIILAAVNVHSFGDPLSTSVFKVDCPLKV